MRRFMAAFTLTLLPGLALAQASGQPQQPAEPAARTEAQAKARAEAEAAVLAGMTPLVAARLRAMLDAAAQKSLPTEPILDRIAEGKAKGAAEGRIAAESEKTLGQLMLAYEAMVRAGRSEPSEEEVIRAAAVIERGVTSAQLEAVIGKAPEGRPLTVAFEVLSDLADRGLPVDRALAEVSTRLAAGASDQQLFELKAGLGLQLGRRP
jgi:hypothetical protein